VEVTLATPVNITISDDEDLDLSASPWCELLDSDTEDKI